MDRPCFTRESSYVDEDVETGDSCRRWNRCFLAVRSRCP